jgi:hypothetical protein
MLRRQGAYTDQVQGKEKKAAAHSSPESNDIVGERQKAIRPIYRFLGDFIG